MAFDENQERSPFPGTVADSFQNARRIQAMNDLNVRMGIEKPLHVSEITSTYFNDGLKFFRKSDDPYLMLLEQEATDVLIEDARVTLRNGGTMEPSTIQNINPDNKPLRFVIPKPQVEYDYRTPAGLFVFPSVATEAQLSPASVLAHLGRSLSLVRDYANGRMFHEGAIRMAVNRAEATMAHVLHGIIREDPSTHEDILRDYGELLVRYPQGIKSLSGGEYRVIGKDPQNN